MVSAHDDIAFLANSANRVEILDALADTPLTRQDLHDQTSSSRVTLSRILRDLGDRNWIERTGQEYHITPLGKWVSDEFTRLLDVVRTVRELQDVLTYFPADQLTFDVRCLRDAEIVRHDAHDLTDLVRLMAEHYRTATHVRVLSNQVAPRIVEATWEATARAGSRFEGIFAPNIVENVLTDEALRTMYDEMIESGNVHMYTHDAIPIQVAIIDDTAVIGLTNEQDHLHAVVRSSDGTVRTWASDLFETYRERADLVTPATSRTS